jgi:plastocyanin
MRRIGVLLTGAALALGFGVGAIGIGPAGAKTSKPVNVDGKVNVKGTKDISSKSAASIDIEADDFYFGPTFVKVKPGEKVTVELENEGNASHTFTSGSLNIDEQVAAGKKAKFTITVPSDATAFRFSCTFHESMGMQGAFYTKKGGTAQ